MKKKLVILVILMCLIMPISVRALNVDLFQVLENGSGVNENGNGGGAGESFGNDEQDDVEHGGGSGESFGNCNIGGELNRWLKNALRFTQYAGVGLAVVLTAFDFVQVIGGSKDDDLKNVFNRTIKRLVAVVLLLLTTVLVGWIINLVAPVIDIPNCV